MWNLLATLAAVLLGGSALLSFFNKDKIAELERDQGTHETSLAAAEKNLAAAKEDVAARTSEIETAQSEAEKLSSEAESLKQEKERFENENDTIQSERKELEERFAELEDMKKQFGEAKEIAARINGLKSKISSLDGQIASLEGSLKSQESRVASSNAQVSQWNQRQENLNKGIIEGNFATRVYSVDPDYGFVVLSSGASRGVVAKAPLVVLRNGAPIARLEVTNLESSRSIADIVPGSLAPGTSIQSGDLVVKAN